MSQGFRDGLEKEGLKYRELDNRGPSPPNSKNKCAISLSSQKAYFWE